MSYVVAAFYQFARLPDPDAARARLQGLCMAAGLKGTILLAHEGINGTVAGDAAGIDRLEAGLRDAAICGVRLDRLELKRSTARDAPFQRLKIRCKPEIVTLGDARIDPTRQVGTYVHAKDWNAVIGASDMLVIDVRNGFEVALGSFEGALDPKLERFSDFRAYAAQNLDRDKHRRIAMFCTGGIRCEKASSYLLAQGFAEVLHLQGGILKYLEDVPPGESRWSGSCFVFDERAALGPGLVESGLERA